MDLVANLKMDVSQFISGGKAAQGTIQSLKSEVKALTEVAEPAGARLIALGTALKDMAHSAQIGGAALTDNLTRPILSVGASALAMASQFQQAEIALGTMMKSTVDAKVFLEELKSFAAATPFEFPDLLRASTRLQALGFEAKAVIPIMKIVGDSVAGLGSGAEGIQRITKALGDMNAKGKVSAQEMNQLAEAGINAWEAVATALGVSIPKAMKMAEQGLISSTAAIPAILEGMMKQTGGMMEAQMVTLAGQWSNFKDNLSFVLGDLGAALTPFVQAVMDVAGPVLSFTKDAVKGFSELSPPLKAGVLAFVGLVAAAGPLLTVFAALSSITGTVALAMGLAANAGLGAVLVALAPWIAGITVGVVALVAAWELMKLEPVANAMSQLSNVMSSFWDSTLKPLVETVVAGTVAFANFAGSIIGSGLEAAWDGLKTIGTGLWDVLVGVGNTLMPVVEAFGGLLDALSPLLEPLGSLVGWLLKLAGAIVGGGLLLAWEAFKKILETTLDVLGPLASFIGGSLITGIQKLSELIKIIAGFITGSFVPGLKSAIEAVSKWATDLLSYLPKISGAVDRLAQFFGGMKKEVIDAVAKTGAELNLFGKTTQSSMETARKSLEAAKKEFKSVETEFLAGKKTREDLKRATDNLSSATAVYNNELKIVKPGMDAVNASVRLASTEWNAAKANLDLVSAAFKAGTKDGNELNAAQQRLRDATVVLNTATAAQKKISEETGVAVKQYSGGIKEIKDSLKAVAVETDVAASATKRLKAEVDAAKVALGIAFKGYQAGTVELEKVTEAENKLNIALANQNPDQAAKKYLEAKQKENEAAKKNLEWYENVYVPGYQKALDAENHADAERTKFFSNEYDKIAKAATKQIKIVKDLFEELHELQPGENEIEMQVRVQGLKEAKDDALALAAAFKYLGIVTTKQLEEQVRASELAYEKIKDDADSSLGDRLKAERAHIKDMIALYKDMGIEVPKIYKQKLEEISIALGESLSKQKKRWADFFNDLKGIAGSFQTSAVGSIWDSIFGNNDNDNLDKQSAELKANLIDRAAEWEQYQVDVATQIGVITGLHAEELAAQLADLQANLEEKRAEYDDYQAKTVAGLAEYTAKQDSELLSQLASYQENLDEKWAEYQEYEAKLMEGLGTFRQKQDEQLEGELADIRENLEEKRQEYEDYRRETIEGLGEYKQKQDEQLAEEKASLAENLRERAEEYARFRSDAIAGLNEFRAAQNSKLVEERADLATALAKKFEDYTEYVADVNEKLLTLREASADKLKDELDGLKKSFAEKAKAYGEYVKDVNKKLKNIGEDMAESIDDETRDTKRGIEDKKRAYAREEDETRGRIERELAKGKDANQEQIRDWQEALLQKREDLDIYINRATEDLDEFTDDHKKEADRQTADLKASLDQRTKDFDEYQLEQESKIGTVTAKAAEDLAKQETDLQNSLTKRAQDLAEYQADVALKLVAAQGEHDKAIAAEELKVSTSLAEREKAWTKYQADIAGKFGAAQKAHDDAIAAEELKVTASLTERDKAWIKYEAEIAKKVVAAQKAHDDAISAEELKVTASLIEREKAWEKYTAEIAKKVAEANRLHDESIAGEAAKVAESLAAKALEWDKYQAATILKLEAVTRKEQEELDKELLALQKTMADKLTEYDKFVKDAKLKLDDLAAAHVSVWDGIYEAARGSLQKVGELLTNLGIDFLGDWLGDSLKKMGIIETLKGAFKGIAEAAGDIFTAIGGGLKAFFEHGFELIWDGIKAIGKAIANLFDDTMDIAGGAASAGGGAASTAGTIGKVGGTLASAGVQSLIGAISGVVTAITGVIAVFQAAKMETTMNAIEVSTRKLWIVTGEQSDSILNTLRNTLPKLADLKDTFVQNVIPLLGEIATETREKLLAISGVLSKDIKDVLIDIKNNVVDIVLKMVGIGEDLDSIAVSLDAIEASLTGSSTIEAAFKSATAELAQTIGPKIDNVSTAITQKDFGTSTLVGNLQAINTSINGLNLSSTLTSGFNNLTSTVSGLLSSLDVGQELSQGFNTLNSTISNLGNSMNLSSLSNQMNAITQAIYNTDARNILSNGLSNIQNAIYSAASTQANAINTSGINSRQAPPNINVSVYGASTTSPAQFGQQIANQLRAQGVTF